MLHPTASLQRLRYSLAATFLGRMCLSGGIGALGPEAWATVQEAITLYQQAAPVIKHGISRRCGAVGASWRHPRGWQAGVDLAGAAGVVVLELDAATRKSTARFLRVTTCD